jgi:hypothetical protein
VTPPVFQEQNVTTNPVIHDDAPTTRHRTLRLADVVDEAPAGPVPENVIRYFEDALAREARRAERRTAREPLVA